MNRSWSSLLFMSASLALLGGWVSATPSCCERYTCENWRALKPLIASGYSDCCRSEGDARQTCFNKYDELMNQIKLKFIEAQIACQNGDTEEARRILRDIKDKFKDLLGAVAFQSISKVDGNIENSVALFGEDDWISLGVTLFPTPGQSCKPQSVALVGTKTVNPEATGKTVADAEGGGGTAELAVVVPAESPAALVSCDFRFPSDTQIRVRFGTEATGTIGGTVSLARLQTADGSLRALPTAVDLRVRMLGQTVTLVLDKSSPYNSLEAAPDGSGYLSVALTVDSKSAALAPSLYLEETYFFRFPVTVDPDFRSLRFNLTPSMPGHLYSPVSQMTLRAIGPSTPVPVGGDPCADANGNGIPDGADRTIRAIEETTPHCREAGR